ncbi:MAG: NUDIX domain-containing protein [Rhodoplanes sp.]
MVYGLRFRACSMRDGPASFSMADSTKIRAPILAAGGIVLTEGSKPRIAIVRLRGDKSWVLPKGKLNPNESPLAAAKREVLEETGHEVAVHEFLGSMSYSVAVKIKIVQFWHMQAIGPPVRELTNDVKEVKWLPLKQAVDTLTRGHEKAFLANVGPIALKSARQALRERSAKHPVRHRGKRHNRGETAVPAVHLIASEDGEAERNPFVKVLRYWIESVSQSSMREID